MIINEYALAVEIENGMFEIFDILYFEKDTEIDLKYKKAILDGATGVYTGIRTGIKIGATLEEHKNMNYISEEVFNISEDQNVYLFISNNKIFGLTINKKNDIDDEKYQAAFEGNVILIDVSLQSGTNLGDIWDGQKIIKMV